MRGNLVQQLVACIRHGLSAIGLPCSDGAEGGEQCAVDCLCIVQQRAKDVLDPFDCCGGKGCGVVSWHPLNCCAILDWHMFVRRVLRVKRLGVLVLQDCFVNVERHVKVHEAIGVVPGEHNADEKGTCPVDSDVLVLFEGGLEVEDVRSVG
jgi:hypothetical protein